MAETDSKVFIDGLDEETRDLYLSIQEVLKTEYPLFGNDHEIPALKILRLFNKREEKLLLELRALIYGVCDA